MPDAASDAESVCIDKKQAAFCAVNYSRVTLNLNHMDKLESKREMKQGISLTAAAASEIKRLIREQQIDNSRGLRLGIKGGGCAGFSYVLEFDTIQPTDRIYEIDGIQILVDPTHELYLAGTEVDFQNGLNNRGFVYNNPNASKTCGCGESFA